LTKTSVRQTCLRKGVQNGQVGAWQNMCSLTNYTSLSNSLDPYCYTASTTPTNKSTRRRHSSVAHWLLLDNTATDAGQW